MLDEGSGSQQKSSEAGNFDVSPSQCVCLFKDDISDVRNCEYALATSTIFIAGDQIAHLQWRLRNGAIPAIHHPKLVVVMIGTNDLNAVWWCTAGNATEITRAADGVIQRSVPLAPSGVFWPASAVVKPRHEAVLCAHTNPCFCIR